MLVNVNETFWDSYLRLPFKASPMIKQTLFSDVLPKGWLCMAQIHIILWSQPTESSQQALRLIACWFS